MFFLRLRMWMLVTVLFAILYAIVVVVGRVVFQSGGFMFYLFVSLAMMFLQYLISPRIVEWSMRVKYVNRQQYPRLFQMIEVLAAKAGIPTPRIGIAQIAIPNAFAFGRGIRDGRVCVTEGILKLLNEDELKAVLGHEITHIKNRDVLTIMLLSVIPILLYRLAWHFLFYGQRRDNRNQSAVLLGLAAFVFYFITNLLVLYASRIREYFADRGSVLLGNPSSSLASALYKLAYGSIRTDKGNLREVEGLKAFFINDPSRATKEIRELAQLDWDKNGTIDSKELEVLRQGRLQLSFADKVFELLSTHPNMLKRIKRLSTYQYAV